MNRKTLSIVVSNGMLTIQIYRNSYDKKWYFGKECFNTQKDFITFLKKEGYSYRHLYIKQEELPL